MSSKAQDELEAWFTSHPTLALARAEAMCRLALESDVREGRHRVGYTAVPLIAASKKTLPEQYDALISGYGNLENLRPTLLTVPEKRRLAIFVRQLDDHHAAVRLVEHFLDLAPEFVTPYLRAYFANTGVDGSQLGAKAVDQLVVFDGQTPRKIGKPEFLYSDLVMLGSDVVMLSTDAIVRIDLVTGKERSRKPGWKEPGPLALSPDRTQLLVAAAKPFILAL
ncbi:MAG: hypothetical protein ABTQ32_10920 [Myxococcaceae bacterium]